MKTISCSMIRHYNLIQELFSSPQFSALWYIFDTNSPGSLLKTNSDPALSL